MTTTSTTPDQEMRLFSSGVNLARNVNLLFNNPNGISDTDQFSSAIFTKYGEIQERINAYQEDVRKFPIESFVNYMVRSIAREDSLGKIYVEDISKIIERGFLRLKENGRDRLIGEFILEEHINVIENIRCVKEWGHAEKAKLIHHYFQLMYFISQYTFGVFPPAYDPEYDYVRNKFLGYNEFIEFVQRLSERDALIAKLLYYGASRIEDVILLKINEIEPSSYRISLGDKLVKFPKHVVLDLIEYVKRGERINELAFVNGKGAAVERTHLINAFSRASAKTPSRMRITPSILLKLKSEM